MRALASAHPSSSRRSLELPDFGSTRLTSSNTPSATRSTSTNAPSPNSLSPGNVSQSLSPSDFDLEGTSIYIERPNGTEITSETSSVEIEYMNTNDLSVESSRSANYVMKSPYLMPQDQNFDRRKMLRSPLGDPIGAFSSMSFEVDDVYDL
ncbi:hypothetical protein PGT21_023291 [Puccinia graminis f. sp. tritici]|uniref:Uncharacterized protein n=1 Tax=Puccinia graminis f. sp. tritici TaxID=56615 RepID=A0A5B0M0V9_PUCGR|nr:hypothetical protein PGT21_023291 [Puccinia graminis f. sp. tritici]